MNSLRLLAIMLMFVSTSERWAFLLLGQKLQGHPATLCHRFVRFARRFLPTSVTEVFARSVIAIELLEDTSCPRSFASGSVYLKVQALPPHFQRDRSFPEIRGAPAPGNKPMKSPLILHLTR